MRHLLTPGHRADRINDIPPELLERWRIAGVILDLDNTIAPWDSDVPEAELAGWVGARVGEGIRVVLVSNNHPERVAEFARILGLPYIASAAKPFRRSFRRAMEILGTDCHHTVVIGDQLFTDILGGNLAGMHTVLVEPMAKREYWGTGFLRFLEKLVRRDR